MSKVGVGKRSGSEAIVEVKKQRKRVKLTKLITYRIADKQPEEVDAKECTKCGTNCPYGSFYRHKIGLAGLTAECKSCVSLYDKKRRERDPDAHKKRMREYTRENAEKEAKRKRQWKKSNSDVIRISSQRRMARIANLPDTIGPKEWSHTTKFFNGVCALTLADSVTLDHFVALATGHLGTVKENCYPLCGVVNYAKQDRNPFEWIRKRPDIDANRFDAVVAYLADLNGLTLDEYRQFVDWCYANPRSIDEIKRDNQRYGYVVSSLELWREATGIAFPIRIDFRNNDEKEAAI